MDTTLRQEAPNTLDPEASRVLALLGSALVAALAGTVLLGWYREGAVLSYGLVLLIPLLVRPVLKELRRHREEVAALRRRLADAERHYREFFDAAPVGLYRATEGGRIVAANHRLVQMLGLRREADLLGCGLDGVWSDPEAHRQWLESIIRGAEHLDFEAPVKTADGRTIRVRHAVHVVRAADGAAESYGMLEELSDRPRVRSLRRPTSSIALRSHPNGACSFATAMCFAR